MVFCLNLILAAMETPIIPENDILNKFILCALYLYLIGIYLYCAYLVRYGLNESQFDILSNPDADNWIPLEYLNNITLSLYANNILSNINAVYTDDELDAIAANKEITKTFNAKIEEVRQDEAEAKAAKAAGGAAGVEGGVAGAGGVADLAGIGNAGDGKVNLSNTLGNLQGENGKPIDLGNLKGENGEFDLGNLKGENGEFDLGNLKGENGKPIDLGNLQGKDGKVDLGNLQGKDGKVDLKNFQGENGKVDLKNLKGKDGKPVDLGDALGNLQGKNGEFDLNNLQNNGDAQAALNKFGINFGQ